MASWRDGGGYLVGEGFLCVCVCGGGDVSLRFCAAQLRTVGVCGGGGRRLSVLEEGVSLGISCWCCDALQCSAAPDQDWWRWFCPAPALVPPLMHPPNIVPPTLITYMQDFARMLNNPLRGKAYPLNFEDFGRPWCPSFGCVFLW